MFKKLQEWFDLHLSWFFINGRKQQVHQQKMMNKWFKPKYPIIGLIGKNGAGKDTVYKLINLIIAYPNLSADDIETKYYNKEYVEPTYSNIKFAAYIKQALASFLNVPSECFEHNYLKSKPIYLKHTPRHLMESLGKWGRDIHEDFWVDATMAKVEKDSYYCFTDVRHINESIKIKEKGGILVKVERYRVDLKPELNSEKELDKINYHYYINNSHSIKNTIRQLQTFLNTEHDRD